MSPTNFEKKIGYAEDNLSRKLDWTSRYDNRITFIASIVIAMLGILANACAAVTNWSCLLYVVFFIAGALLFTILFLIYFGQYPNTKSPNSSLVFFDTISKMSFANFKNKFKEASDEEYLDDLLNQTHINSKILAKKFSNLKWCLRILLISIIPWITAIYFSKIII